MLSAQEARPHAAGLGLVEQLRVALGAMLQHAFPRLKRQVQSVVLRVALFQLVDHAQALQVVLKTTVFCHAAIKCVLPRMAERRMTQVVRE